MKIRVTWFIVLALAGFASPWWVFVPLVVGYSIRYIGYEVLAVALLVDAAYGYASVAWPLYTVLTTILLFTLTALRPRLQWYEN